MRPKKSLGKIRSFLQKTFRTIESFTLVVYPDSPTSIASNSTVSFCNGPEDNDENAKANVVVFSQTNADANHSVRSTVKISDEGTVRKKQEARENEGAAARGSTESADAAKYVLAKKMKEVDMMDAGDVDVADALRCYSRLTSPVYLEIVNKFFNDMYEEYYLPEPSVGLSCSSGRRTLSASSRRLLDTSGRRLLDPPSRRLLDTPSRRLAPLML